MIAAYSLQPVNRFYALDATTGKPIPQFGRGGKGRPARWTGSRVGDLYVAATSPGIIYQDMIIMGSRVSEGTDAAPGHIRAYDVHRQTTMDISHDSSTRGARLLNHGMTPPPINILAVPMPRQDSASMRNGLLFAPTGSASFDFYGGKRKGNNLYANCILAP